MVGLIIFTLIFTLVLAGAGYWLLSGTQAEIALRRRARDWPTTAGVVTNSRVEERQWTTRSGVGFRRVRRTIHNYTPVISYTYQVGGKSYQSSKYKNEAWASLNPKVADKIVADHPQGKTVTATYNPEDPAQAYLELDTSVNMQWIRRIGGFLLLAAAAGLFVLGAYRVGQSLVTQLAANNIPAAVPAQTEDLKKALARDLGMTCQSGRFRAYTTWECAGPASAGTTHSYVRIYSRERASDRVDYISALTGETDQQELAFFVTVATLALPSADPQQVQDWLAETQPTLDQLGDEAETTINGVKLVLSNPNGMGVVLRIGELQ